MAQPTDTGRAAIGTLVMRGKEQWKPTDFRDTCTDRVNEPTAASSGGGDLAGLSKAELTRPARDLDVPGRSKLSRPELEKAVGKARRKAA